MGAVNQKYVTIAIISTCEIQGVTKSHYLLLAIKGVLKVSKKVSVKVLNIIIVLSRKRAHYVMSAHHLTLAQFPAKVNFIIMQLVLDKPGIMLNELQKEVLQVMNVELAMSTICKYLHQQTLQ